MRLIDGDALGRYLNDCAFAEYAGVGYEREYETMCRVLKCIENAPTVDAVPVVRCRDCKEWDEENHWCNIRDSYGWDYKPNDYCSYGVRKAGK